jgi:hypothetical protein
VEPPGVESPPRPPPDDPHPARWIKEAAVVVVIAVLVAVLLSSISDVTSSPGPTVLSAQDIA